MTQHATCPHGHRWEAPPGPGATETFCPVCGSPSLPLARVTDSPAERAAPGPAWGPPGYEVLESLGRGGMGVVYKARQLSLNRLVALKLMHADLSGEPASLARFRREAEAVARLQHPNIVQIFEVGEHDGRPYLVMEYVGAGNLARCLARELPAPREAARLVEVLARAVQHAHDKGVIHRDLKPANILLAGGSVSPGPVAGLCEAGPASQRPATASEAGPTSQRPATGPGVGSPPLAEMVPKVADFGLAKSLGAAGPTLSGEVVGTPSYMAPEQAAGRLREVGPRADVYALGAILYECLCGRPPFDSEAAFDAVRQVLYEAPTAPGRWRPHLPRELETICLKCLRKAPEDRYPSAAALADDLARFRAGEVVRARPAGAWGRLREWARVRPGAAVAAAAAGVGLVGAVVGAVAFNPLAVAAVAVLALLAGAGWYGARLRAALGRLEEARAASERNVERLHLLLETTRRLVAARGLDEVLRLLGEATARLANAERATIYLVDRERGELWSKVALGDEVGEIRVPLGQGVAGAVAATGETILLTDPYADPRFNPEVDRRTGYTTRSLLTVPILGRRGRRLGVLQALNRRDGTFGSDDIDILRSLAASAALAVEPAAAAGDVTAVGETATSVQPAPP